MLNIEYQCKIIRVREALGLEIITVKNELFTRRLLRSSQSRHQLFLQLLQIIHLYFLNIPSHNQPTFCIRFRYDMKMNMVNFLMCDSSVILVYQYDNTVCEK